MISISEKEFMQIVDYVKGNFGVNLIQKKTLIVARLQNFLVQNNFDNFKDYFDYVVSDKTGNAKSVLIDKLTTNHTFFMREQEHFSFFNDRVLPYLKTVESEKKDLRIWSAGCSSGEEPYTLAMIMASFFGNEKALWDTKILATDISTQVLETASSGIYFNDSISVLPEYWKKHYFEKLDDGKSVVNNRIKNEVIFRKFNLMEAVFPFKKKFHVIFCRNVMIYFDAITKRELISKFYEFTEPGGYLFIGHSESLANEKTKYRYVMPAVYRKL